jgi:hypothetical protein
VISFSCHFGGVTLCVTIDEGEMYWRKFIASVACAASIFASSASGVAAEEKIALCHAGLVKLASFAEHLKALRSTKRYEPEEIAVLAEQQRKGGPEFFSSQVIVQESQSGSGTYDLRMLHGLSDAKDYRNVTAWDCQMSDYPIVYFVGFRVRQIERGTIFVSREKDIVNVISLSALDPTLDSGTKVQVFERDQVLCQDIGKGCDQHIFYGRHE